MPLVTVSPFLLGLLALANHTAFHPSPTIQTPGGWDITKLGIGGEPFVSTDFKGTVYVSSHLPTQVLLSRDSGANFEQKAVFKDSLGDMVAMARKDGGLTVSYMTGTTDGMRTQVSENYGSSFTLGSAPSGRPLDREWMVYDGQRNRLYMIYSDGFIGGPASKGVFLSVSLDKGLTFKELGRIDHSPAGSYPVDPHIALSSDGRIYAFWTITKDRDTIESYDVATSDDQGATWRDEQAIANLSHDYGDRQERWMLGGVCATGQSTISCFYVTYDHKYAPYGNPNSLRVAVRTSSDGGQSFGKVQWAVGESEAARATGDVAKSDLQTQYSEPWIQVMPWATYDPSGKLHVMWFDNREGTVGGDGAPAQTKTKLAVWHLRHVVLGSDGAKSERVGNSFTCIRPAMDYMCCCTDQDNLYATWAQNPGSVNAWDFTGELWFGKMRLNKSATN